MKIIKIVITSIILVFASSGYAAPVTLPFEVVVQVIGNGGAVGIDAGDVFQGQISYDNANLTEDNGNFLAFPPDLIIDFAFNSGSNFVEPQLFINSATFSPAGALVDLDFSVDVPNQFFFSTQGLNFNFEFSKLVNIDDVPTQVTVAAGNGIVREPVVATPLPGALWLFLSGAGLLSARRRVLGKGVQPA